MQLNLSRLSLRPFIRRPVQVLLRTQDISSRGTYIPDIHSYAAQFRKHSLMYASHADIE